MVMEKDYMEKDYRRKTPTKNRKAIRLQSREKVEQGDIHILM